MLAVLGYVICISVQPRSNTDNVNGTTGNGGGFPGTALDTGSVGVYSTARGKALSRMGALTLFRMGLSDGCHRHLPSQQAHQATLLWDLWAA